MELFGRGEGVNCYVRNERGIGVAGGCVLWKEWIDIYIGLRIDIYTKYQSVDVCIFLQANTNVLYFHAKTAFVYC